MITILCAQDDSNYYKIPGLDIWNKERNAWNYYGKNITIAHPPCQQWSKLKSFAKSNQVEKNLAYWCWYHVNQWGGIFEHPKGTSFYKHIGADTKKIQCVWQSWWGFRAKKETYLYFHQVKPLPMPLSLNAICKGVQYMDKNERSKMTLEMCQYLINCANNSSK